MAPILPLDLEQVADYRYLLLNQNISYPNKEVCLSDVGSSKGPDGLSGRREKGNDLAKDKGDL